MAKPDNPSEAELAQRHVVGNRIRDLRESAGLSQMDLAERSGMHRPHLGLIERGATNPTLGSLFRIASALSVEVAQLFEGSEKGD